MLFSKSLVVGSGSGGFGGIGLSSGLNFGFFFSLSSILMLRYVTRRFKESNSFYLFLYC